MAPPAFGYAASDFDAFRIWVIIVRSDRSYQLFLIVDCPAIAMFIRIAVDESLNRFQCHLYRLIWIPAGILEHFLVDAEKFMQKPGIFDMIPSQQ